MDALLSQPKDCDIEEIVVQAVTAVDGSVIVRASGGAGWWVDGTDVAVVDTVTDFEAVATLPSGTPAARTLSARMIAQLVTWAEAGTSLRFRAFPDGNLFDDDKAYVLLPRRPFPVEGE